MTIHNHEDWKEHFIMACKDGHLEDVRHLCQKQYLDLGGADIHINDELGFCWACFSGHLDVVKYLLTSPELKEAGHSFADLHANDEEGFRGACAYGHLEVVKYLLTSPDLIEADHSFADLHAVNDEGFRMACNHEHWNVVRWLVLDYGIEKTPAMNEIIKDYSQAQKYFQVIDDELKELKNVLHESRFMNIKNKKQWEMSFVKACQAGHLEKVRHLCQKQYFDKGWADIHHGDEYGFRVACWNGYLDVVKYLLTSPELKEAGHTFSDLHARDDTGFLWACCNGYLDLVKYLLTSPELIDSGHSFANLHAGKEEGFRWACGKGHLELVQYLLTSKELIPLGHTWADLHAWDESGFRLACENGHLDVVKYLLTSHALIEAGHSFADVHAVDDDGFRLALHHQHWNVVRWLVMDYGIEKTFFIEKMIQEYPQVQDYFRAREELKDIQTTLETSNPKPYPPSSETHDADRRAPKKAKKL